MKKTIPLLPLMRCLYFVVNILILLVLVLVSPTHIFAAGSASLNVLPSQGQYGIGQTFTTSVVVNAGGVASNAFQTTVSYPRDILDATSISTGGSVCTLWTSTPSINASAGTISFSCGLPTPGYSGGSGTIARINFKAKKSGTAIVTQSSSRVLANDGAGTDILGQTNSATYTIIVGSPNSPSIESVTHSNQDIWYAVRTFEATWNKTSGIDGFSVIFDQDQTIDAPTQITQTSASYSVSSVDDGIWYLHVRAHSEGGWSDTATYRIQIDGSAPHSLELIIDPPDKSDRRPMLSFSAVDEGSGLDRYKLSTDEGEWIVVTSPYIPEQISVGNHVFTIRAIDASGNFATTSKNIEITSPGSVTFATPQNNQLFYIAEGIVITGQAKPNADVTLFIDGNALPDQVVVNDQGNFSYPFTGLLRPGTHTLEGKVTFDGIDGEKSGSVQFKIDGSLVQIGNYRFPVWFLVGLLICVIILLLVIILWLLFFLKRRKDKKRNCNALAVSELLTLKNTLDQKITETQQQESVEAAKYRLNEVKQTIDSEITESTQRLIDSSESEE
ncbi:hypothetical protein HGA91_05130 [candidate division WWE3 bacterium]|nr:hypothetical protein [candidate division WWE3 bacterium]